MPWEVFRKYQKSQKIKTLKAPPQVVVKQENTEEAKKSKTHDVQKDTKENTG